MQKKRTSFTGSVGFVMAAAASAVGLGNIWRFPYLAAKDGGGLFIVIYLILALTYGFTLLITEIAIGRKTKQGPLTAYGVISKKFGWIGIFGCLVPFMILPYYCIIGGWVLKYLIVFVTGNMAGAAGDDFFTGFLGNIGEPIIYNVIFLLATVFVVFRGVEKGIEKSSRILMPILIILVLGIAIFSLTLRYTADDGTTRTGLDGFKILVIPSLEGKSLSDVLHIVIDAMGQLFYSISVAMGIMIAYGSYLRDEENISRSVSQIEIFDTAVAFLAGVMLIPAVYVFMGEEGMKYAGPGLMFVAMPKVFAAMGGIGRFIGIGFFFMVLFAALTSSISILEAVVSSFIDKFGWSRKRATVTEGVIALAIGTVICLGYNVIYFELPMPGGATGQLLDIFDYLSNSILMPIVSISTCVMIGWFVGPQVIINEVRKNGERFGREKLYTAMIRYITPVLLTLLLLGSLGIIK